MKRTKLPRSVWTSIYHRLKCNNRNDTAGHQTHHLVDAAALEYQELEGALGKGRHDPPRELFTGHRHDAESGIFRCTGAEIEIEVVRCRTAVQPAAETHRRRPVERCSDARRGSEVNPFAVIDPGDVQQQQLLVETLGHLVVAEDLLAKNRWARAGGQRERCRQGATEGGKP